MQSRQPWIRGRTLTEHGKVTAVREADGELFVSLEVWGENDKGERLVIGEAEVAVPA